MVTILTYISAIQYGIIGLTHLTKHFYLKSKFKTYIKEEEFEIYQKERLSIKNISPIDKYTYYIPLLGIFKLPTLLIKVKDEVTSYNKVVNDWDSILVDKLFKDISKEYERLKINIKSLDLAKELIEMNIHKEVVISTTNLLLSSIKLIVLDDDNTQRVLNETINEYYNVLLDIKNTPNIVDVTTLSEVKNIFNSISYDVKNSNALF